MNSKTSNTLSSSSRNILARDLVVFFLICLLFFLPVLLDILSIDRPRHHNSDLPIMLSIIYVIVFAINYYWVVDRTILKRKKIWMFFLINICILIVGCVLIHVLFTQVVNDIPRHFNDAPPPPERFGIMFFYVKFIIRDGVMMILSAGLALALRLTNYSKQMHRRELEINAEKRQIELMSLKAQLNPHFLFNTLNNIYALIAFAPDRAQKAVHDLSSMLRFMIYDSDSAVVSVQKELDFIADYVELMKLRLSSSVKLDICIDKSGTSDFTIAPLIFLTLVENTFKHGTTGKSDAFISIDIRMETVDVIACRVSNSCNEKADSVKDSHGVGLENIRKQLSLLYPGRHEFQISESENVYTVNLKIRLSTNPNSPD